MIKRYCDACGEQITQFQDHVVLKVVTAPRKPTPVSQGLEELDRIGRLPKLSIDLHVVCYQSRYEEALT